jgi:hypothetical protein
MDDTEIAKATQMAAPHVRAAVSYPDIQIPTLDGSQQWEELCGSSERPEFGPR